MRRRTAQREVLKFCVTREQKELLQRAAALSGRSVTDFVVGSALAAAEEAIRTHQVITLTAQDSLAFARAVLDPPEPNENLRALAQRHRKFVCE